jgi:hypothetical protein
MERDTLLGDRNAELLMEFNARPVSYDGSN